MKAIRIALAKLRRLWRPEVTRIETFAQLRSLDLNSGMIFDLFEPANVSRLLVRFLDVDALADAAAMPTLSPRQPLTLSLTKRELRQVLLPGVTPREAQILTELLPHLGKCVLEIPSRPVPGGSRSERTAACLVVEFLGDRRS